MAFVLDVNFWQKKLGIILDDVGDGFYRASQCPFCGQENKFYVNTKGYYECKSANKCGKKGHVNDILRDSNETYGKGESSTSYKSSYNSGTTENLNKLQDSYIQELMESVEAQEYLASRKISMTAAKVTGIGYHNGYLSFPIFRGDTITSIKHKSIYKKPDWFEPISAPTSARYGTFLLHTIDLGKPVFVTEGEMDALTLIEYGLDNVVCMKGCKTNDPFIDKVLEKAKEVIIIPDMDSAGQKAVDAWGEKYGFSKCKVISLPQKDANDCLKAGMTQEELLALLKGRKPVTIPGTISLSDVKKDLEENPEYPIMKFPIPEIDRILGGLYASSATIISGQPGVGKTAFIAGIIERASKSGDGVIISSLEEPEKKITSKYFSHFSNDFVTFFTPKDYKIFYDKKKMAKYFTGLIENNNMKLYILDHIEWVSDYYKGETYKAPAAVIKTLVEAAKVAKAKTGQGIHMILLHHLKKIEELEDKKTGDIRIKRPTKNDLLGGGVREAANIVFLHREYDNEKGHIDDSGAIEVIVDKNREFLLTF